MQENLPTNFGEDMLTDSLGPDLLINHGSLVLTM